MEKYSQYRDKGSGIAPFFPIPTQPAGLYLPFHIFLFVIRLPLLLTVSLFYFLILSWLPVGSLPKKAALWTIIGIPGIWWIDLQIDGVRRGSLAKHTRTRLPGPRTVIASSFTSPLDCLYLAAIFDPIFTASWPGTRKVQRINLFQAMLRAFAYPQLAPPPGIKLVDINVILKENPDASVVVLPECTTTNSRGILPPSPSILTVPPTTKIFPLNIRYTPGDVATPIPGTYLQFLWTLCSQPSHCIRVRIAECVYNTSVTTHDTGRPAPAKVRNSYDTNYFDSIMPEKFSDSDTVVGSDGGEEGLTMEERKVLDQIAEDLARLGRVKRVALGVKEKEEFVNAWRKKRR